MKLFRKLSAILLVGAMILSLAACGGSGSSNTSSDSAGTGTASGNAGGDAQAAADEAPYEIVVEIMGSGVPMEDVALVEAAVNEITLPAINCTVKFRDIAIADHVTQLGLLGTDGEQLDIIYVGYTSSMANLKANGLLVPLDDLLAQYGQEMVAKAGVLMDACKIDGQTYCVPGNYHPAVQDALVLDKEIVETYNIQIPENPANTYEYLEKLYKAIKDSGFEGYATSAGDGTGVRLVGYQTEEFGSAMQAGSIYGILLDAFGTDTTIINKFDTDEYMEACKFVRHCWEEGYLDPDSLTSGRTQVDAMRAGLIVGSVSSVNSTFALNNRMIIGRDSVTYPIGDYTVSGTSIPEYGLGVTVTSKRPDKAVQLLNLIMTNADLANIMNYGIEGKHYVKVSEHIIDYPEGVDRMTVGWGNQITSFGDVSQIYHRLPYTEEWYDTIDNYAASNARLSIAYGYTFDMDPVRTQVAACSAALAEYQPVLACGMVEDVEGQVEALRAALHAGGIDDIIAENQRQFDAWLAANGK